jgi:hypothetical protein
MDLIRDLNCWEDYDPVKTRKQVISVFSSKPRLTGLASPVEAESPANQSLPAGGSLHSDEKTDSVDNGIKHCGFNPVHVQEILSEIHSCGSSGHKTAEKPGYSMNCACCKHPVCCGVKK